MRCGVPTDHPARDRREAGCHRERHDGPSWDGAASTNGTLRGRSNEHAAPRAAVRDVTRVIGLPFRSPFIVTTHGSQTLGARCESRPLTKCSYSPSDLYPREAYDPRLDDWRMRPRVFRGQR